MKNTFKSRGMSLFKTIAFALTLGMMMSACAQTGRSGADSWKEEVLLHDGQKIMVERSQTYKGRSEPGQPAPIGEHTIRFSLPGSSKPITWTSEYGEDLGRTDFNLSALHVKDNVPYVVAEPNLCLAYNKWGRPNPPYVVFKYDGSAWQRIAFELLPAEFTTVNVVKRTRGIDVENLVKARQLSVEQVTKLISELERPESKAILRTKINYDPECIPMVGNGKGRWRSAAWFETKPNLEACREACFQDSYDDKHCPCNSILQRK